jgi:hypothetical protein
MWIDIKYYVSIFNQNLSFLHEEFLTLYYHLQFILHCFVNMTVCEYKTYHIVPIQPKAKIEYSGECNPAEGGG